MTRLYQIVAIIFVAFGAFVLYLSLDLSYSADYGPGPGFFSFWLGILLILLGGIDFIGTTRRPREPLPEGFIPDRPGLRRLLFISASLVAVIFLMNPLGYTLTILPFSIFLLQDHGPAGLVGDGDHIPCRQLRDLSALPGAASAITRGLSWDFKGERLWKVYSN